MIDEMASLLERVVALNRRGKAIAERYERGGSITAAQWAEEAYNAECDELERDARELLRRYYEIPPISDDASPRAEQATLPAEPTERMVVAGRQAVAEFADCGSFETLAIQAYKAMTDEALGLRDKDSNE